MKFWFSLFLCLFSLPLLGAPVENPFSPKIIREGFFIPSDKEVHLRFGYEGDFVADARLEQTVGPGPAGVDSYKQETNAGVTTFSFLNRFDIFSVLGSSRTRTEWRFTYPEGTTHRAELETLYNFLWGGGGESYRV